MLYFAPVDRRFMDVYRSLRRAYGPQRWWPVTPPGATRPAYTGGPKNARQRFEVAVGTILTQNTAWTNVERAVENLNRIGAMSAAGIEACDVRSLARVVRPAGYFNQKAKRLKTLAAFFLSRRAVTREALLALNGVGPETADSIMLYAYDEPFFVVDAYTRRLCGRLALVEPDAPYEEIRNEFETNLPLRVDVYKEYHALIVEHGKHVCRKVPLCEICLFKRRCRVYFDKRASDRRKERRQELEGLR
jgi:endonuclease-3 related protein